jgi:L-ribulose-5-phosphate 4-epimerase
MVEAIPGHEGESMKMDELRLRKELATYSQRSFSRRLVRGTGGNLSVRVPGTENILITPSGISLADVEPETNILMTLQGEVLQSPPGLKPSKETPFHLEVYRLRLEVQAIAHVHPPYATAYANKGLPLPLVTVSAGAYLKHVPCIDCAIPGSSELLDLVRDCLEADPGVTAILMKAHGILTLGRDLMDAFYLADSLEDAAEVAYIEGTIRG